MRTSELHLLPPPPGFWYTPFFFLAGPSSLHEIAVSAFQRSPLGRANTFSFLPLRVTPRMCLECFSDSTLFLSATVAPPRIFIISSASVMYLPNFSADINYFRFPPIFFHTLSTALPHLVEFRSFVTFSRTALSTMVGNLFLGMLLALYRYCRFNLTMSLFLLNGYIPSSALNAEWLVVLEHPSFFFS